MPKSKLSWVIARKETGLRTELIILRKGKCVFSLGCLS